MNCERIYEGNLYIGSIDEDNLYEKDVLLIKFGKKFIKLSNIQNKLDLISLYTFLKYLPLSDEYPLSYYMYEAKGKLDIIKENEIVVDNDSLSKYYNGKWDMKMSDIEETLREHKFDKSMIKRNKKIK